ncbi:ribosomal-processing cysteine protease Prp [Streptococcus halichoeri]|uniref:ribosomal-processing cysteine protease Prp n=1 Tax=Streptococcus halichoeri TaxID=254785 RepID=UPI001356A450|nr:ribosomal-processing cysteine protease Prp [Streptococcus halichoeri]
MIKASFSRDEDGTLRDVTLTGHAGSGEYGFDIVCAAVSALAINFINSLEALTQTQADVTMDAVEGGYMRVSVPHDTSKNGQLLFESFLLGMTNISENASEFVQTTVI